MFVEWIKALRAQSYLAESAEVETVLPRASGHPAVAVPRPTTRCSLDPCDGVASRDHPPPRR